MTGLGDVNWKGWAALATFAVQNGAAVLIMRYSKIHGSPYSSQVAVLMQELAVKLPISMILYAFECNGILSAASSIAQDLRERPMEWAQLAVPAILYTIQNTMLYVGYANVEAAIGQITYQSKILWTALFSVVILGKKLSVNQWLALLVLAVGVIAVQITPAPAAAPSPPAVASEAQVVHDDPHGKRKGHGAHHHHDGEHADRRGLAAVAAAEQNPLMGVGALVLAAVCTAFASVYFEKMLKGASKPSLWLRNIQLAIYCSAIAAIGVVAADDPMVNKHGWMYGFGAFTWLSVFWQALGGILVAVTIKYADNILRGFSQGLAIIFGAIGSYFLFDFQITFVFCLGSFLVMVAIFIYGSSAQTPQELCESLGGSLTCCNSTVAPAAKYNEVSPVAESDDAAGDNDSADSTSSVNPRQGLLSGK